MQLTKERLKSLSKRAGEMDADGWMNGDGILSFARALLSKGA